MNLKSVLSGVALTAVLVVGGGFAAQAASVSTSMSDWTTGTVGSWRTANSGTAQSIKLQNCVFSEGSIGTGLPSPKQQLQLQQNNAPFVPISKGNKTPNCGTAASWGAGFTGSYRYQLNGVYSSGGVYWGCAGCYLFSASPVTITY